MSKLALRAVAFTVAILVTAALFGYLYRVARETVLNEIRSQALAVAMAVAAGVEPEEVEAIQTPADQANPPFQKIQRLISQIALYNRDIHYIYLMRRDPAPGAKPSDLLYVVDQITGDDNLNGTIDEEERTIPVGQPYDASQIPAMVRGWDKPAADDEPTHDPPYPDSISGYAPIRNAQGETIAIVGADISTQTIGAKMLLVRIVNGVGFLVVSGLLMLAICLYLSQRELAQERATLVVDLREALGNVRTLSGLLPVCASCKRIRNEGGDWEVMESYLGRKSEAEFSHGICPECARQLYPEVTGR